MVHLLTMVGIEYIWSEVWTGTEPLRVGVRRETGMYMYMHGGERRHFSYVLPQENPEYTSYPRGEGE